jgi:transcriptional regulator with XRE-family HTH domain
MTASITRREFGGAAVATAAAIKAARGYAVSTTCIENLQWADWDGLGERLRKAREARGLSIEQCATALDPTRRNYFWREWSDWEQGLDEPLQSQWPFIEALLGIPATQLIYGGSELAKAKQWIKQSLEDFAPEALDDITPDNELNSCAMRLNSLREERGMTAAECAKAVGCSGEEWLRIEAGAELHAKEALKITELFDVDYHWLCFGEYDTDVSSFCDRLQQTREAKGLSIEQCAERAGISPEKWEEHESYSRPFFCEGVKMAKALEVDPYWLAIGDTA